ncbi:YrdB family protein [Sporosarcina sp. Te-1]|uniref:YrdB family protein n=1 Tax=Sporosarcina sp. Te-1 TaxID=2818390 RepID=UPI001A9FFFE2|nr:YrdB family protein [Sporosarcina sp. Te-1]QTD39670.1 YrdB family protein [Sporosarcina sp. Te-1]
MNVLLRFLLELFGLALYGYAGYKLGTTPTMKVALSIGFPVSIAVIWGLFGSPQATVQLPASLHAILEGIVFLTPVAFLLFLGKGALGWGYGFLVIVNRIFIWVWAQ